MSKPRWKPNVTVAAVVERDGRFLVVEEVTSDGLRLNNPAGHLDPGETPQRAVERETLEETGRRFFPEHLIGVYLTRSQRPERCEDVTYLRFAYAGSVSEPLPGHSLDSGIVRTLWLTLDELRACPERHRSPLLLRCIEDHVAGHRLPLDLVHADESLFTGVLKP
ncbi:MAG: NUDIX hydrolase [Burkholderiales bacterium]|jgi:8-oxo-dGTP pyrophosphatase MutT (NUDIX family)|nr:NUDIX hydrolase [Burkholderiales bacterium]MBP6250615.1 NUDIX hydrolase [Leptothrix sp. (in: b-proteobacteria)]MBP7521111.1 NUDIX hydrolase [Leptothrix sp. (in: b-proteobacteria)]HQY10517.1 NUDIX hydrolase [Burkholderiaceae bacterium]